MPISLSNTQKQLRLLIIFVVLAFFQSLDTSITNLSLSYIGGDLATAPLIAAWVNTIYYIGYSVSLLTSGWLASHLGQVKLTRYAILTFLISSLGCALSFHILGLCFFRLILGLSAGLSLPLIIGLLIRIMPPEKKAVIASSFFTLSLLAPFIAPFLGGALSQLISWRLMFLINIPICLLSLWAVDHYLGDYAPPCEKQRLDKAGLLFLISTVSFIKILVDKGSQYDWFKNPVCIVLIAAGLISLLYLIFREHSIKNPVIDFSLFKQERFLIGSVLTILGYIMLYGVIVLIPHLLFNHMSFMPINAGLCMVPIAIIPILLFFPIEKALENKQQFVFLYGFNITVGICLFILSLLTSSVSSLWLQVVYFFIGIPLSMFLSPLFVFTTQDVKPEKSTQAVSLFLFTRTFTAGLAGSLILYLWDRRQIFHYFRLVEIIQNQHRLPKAMLHEYLASLKVQSTILATNDLFRLFFFLSIASLSLIIYYHIKLKLKRSPQR
jgi:DHA2 family multidrug resistance protein